MNAANFSKSLAAHQIKGKGTVWLGLPVTLTGGDNPYLSYPVRGVLVIIEQATDLRPNVTVFHRLKDDGSLGPPVQVRGAEFFYDGKVLAAEVAPAPPTLQARAEELVKQLRFTGWSTAEAKVDCGRVRQDRERQAAADMIEQLLGKVPAGNGLEFVKPEEA